MGHSQPLPICEARHSLCVDRQGSLAVDVITAIKRMMLNRKGSAARFIRRSLKSRLPILRSELWLR